MFYTEMEAEHESEEQGWGRLVHPGWSRKDRGQYQQTISSESFLKGVSLLPLHHRIAPHAGIWTRKE